MEDQNWTRDPDKPEVAMLAGTLPAAAQREQCAGLGKGLMGRKKESCPKLAGNSLPFSIRLIYNLMETSPDLGSGGISSTNWINSGGKKMENPV